MKTLPIVLVAFAGAKLLLNVNYCEAEIFDRPSCLGTAPKFPAAGKNRKERSQ
jgi:hypothetical protein